MNSKMDPLTAKEQWLIDSYRKMNDKHKGLIHSLLIALDAPIPKVLHGELEAEGERRRCEMVAWLEATKDETNEWARQRGWPVSSELSPEWHEPYRLKARSAPKRVAMR